MKKEVYRYYCLYRPPMPGGIPKNPVHIETWGSRPFVKEINHNAWGIVDYDHRLTNSEMNEYELAPANVVQAPIFAEAGPCYSYAHK